MRTLLALAAVSLAGSATLAQGDGRAPGCVSCACRMSENQARLPIRAVVDIPPDSGHDCNGLIATVQLMAPDSSVGFRLPSGNVRSPDASFVARGRLKADALPDDFGDLAPDLTVEVLSPSERPRRLARTVALAAVTLAGGNALSDEPANAASLLEAPEPIAAALRSRFGKDLLIRSLSVRADSADVEVQDAAVPEHLDRYPFEDGALGTPEPVQAGRNQRKLKASLFPFAEVDLSILPRLVADALLRTKTTDARVAQVRIERLTGYEYSETWGWPRIYVIVDGPRGGAVVEYDLEGKHKSTKRW